MLCRLGPIGRAFAVSTLNQETFLKYSTNVGDATEEEMNALEFTSSYTLDDLGNIWLVSEELQLTSSVTSTTSLTPRISTSALSKFVRTLNFFGKRIQARTYIRSGPSRC
ncbi:uncharacterized protein LMH87_009219 [Akanthomyces muscarius]|uniref:Uncharacterized protein n=1 Tax=Akanthomyces muscarius TaxID=2231603 RepID=A0A9W8UMR6_AKAMU|nr:uncharacterized protein LMH87_009219 [Akanthomyces muscarius]KAJ4158705.1 hypothetical protein LMH87_009219 [Akanthomyces muscarius]